MVFGILNFYANRNFYEKPDGEALSEKIMSSSELPVKLSIILTCGDILMLNKNAFGLFTFQRLLQRFLPLECMAFMFTVTTHATAKIRQKNDSFNHAIGALSTIPVVRVYKPLQTTIVVGTLLVFGAIAGKSFADDPKIGRKVGNIPTNDQVICWPEYAGLKMSPLRLIKYD